MQFLYISNLRWKIVVFAEAGQSIAAAAPFTSVMKWTMMRHGNRVKHLGRAADQRKALLRSLTTEVLRHGQIKTTKVSTSSCGSSSSSSNGSGRDNKRHRLHVCRVRPHNVC